MTGRPGEASDGCDPPSEGQGIREREIILHRLVGPLTNLADREAPGRLSAGVRSPSDRRGSVGTRREGDAQVIEDLVDHGRLFDHGFVASVSPEGFA